MTRLLLLFSLLALGACRTSQFPDGQTWRLTEIGGQSVPDSVRTTLRFDRADNSYSGAAACNTYRGTYTRTDARLSLGPAAATKRMCEAIEWETQYFNLLPQVTGYTLENRVFRLVGEGRVLAVFRED